MTWEEISRPGNTVTLFSETYDLEEMKGAPFIGQKYIFEEKVGDFHILRLIWGTIERQSFLRSQIILMKGEDWFGVIFGEEQQYCRYYKF